MKRAQIAALAAAFIITVIGCDIQPVSGRFTYSVKYRLTSSPAMTADVTYKDASGTPVILAAQALPWSVEFAMSYDYQTPFVPELAVDKPVGNELPPGESITYSILWKDYRLDFQEQVLESETTVNNDAAAVTISETLYGPQLPRP